MGIGDDQSPIWVILVPAVGGLVGFLLMGPFGFLAGVTVLLVIGGLVDSQEEANSEQVEELRQQVQDLEQQVAELSDDDQG